MEYRILGKTGLEISSIGLGGIPIQRSDAASVKTLVDALCEHGVNYIDTARGYTVSEKLLGDALDGRREQFILATKSMARTKEAMEKDIKTSMELLKTDYIDLYQVHNPSGKDLEQVVAPGGALEALLEAKGAGKIGHIGVTVHLTDVFEKALEMDWVETIMFPYNIVETQGEELIRRCASKNIGFICMKPLAGGALEDASLALRFIRQNQNVSVVIPGMYSLEEAAENVAAWLDSTPLTEDEQKKITQARAQLGTQFCRRCNYCQPCSAGINISGVFLFEGYLSRYGLEGWAKERYAALNKKAGDCVGCGVCETRCPYQLPIREMLKKCAEAFGC